MNIAEILQGTDESSSQYIHHTWVFSLVSLYSVYVYVFVYFSVGLHNFYVFPVGVKSTFSH